jgi:hypothetical protein
VSARWWSTDICSDTGLAAIGTGSVHAFVGALGMLLGAALYALSKIHILSVAALGPVRLPQLTGVPDIAWFAALATLTILGFAALEFSGRRR